MGFFGNYINGVKSTTKRILTSNGRLNQMHEETKRSWKHLTQKQEKKAKQSSFEEICQEYNLSKEDLVNKYKELSWGCYAFLMGSFICFCLFLYYLFANTGVGILSNFLSVVLAFTIGFAFLVKAYSNSLICASIKNKKMLKFNEWRELKEYFPSLNLEEKD